MRATGKQTKRAVSLILCLALLISMLAFALTVRAEEVNDLTDTGADTYYLWGENSNSPNFNGTTPTGTFTYDSSKGYYYYDLSGSSGDYCFVVSKISNSANSAVKTPAVQKIASAGSYYLSSGNYHGFNCLHLWNPSGDTIRISFTSETAGLTAVKAGSEAATQAPTTAPKPTTPQPTQGGSTTPTTTQPTTPTPTQGGSTTDKSYIYCENEAGWSSVTAYLWNSSSDSNKAWPGAAMTNIGGNIWRYELSKSYKNIIFSNNGQSQTTDLTYPGDGYIWNNKTNSWSIYDTSPLQVSSFATDLEAPQYNGVGITLSAEAEGEGTVYYKFSVTNGSSTTVLSDFSTANKALWTPQTAGTYTLTYDFRDAKGNTNQRTKSYVIEDGSTVVAPYIKTVTPNGGDIQNNSNVQIKVTAGGGNTGTNLLFYKYTIKDPSNNIANVPYYTRSANYTFKPTALGLHTLTINVQGSDNKTIERSYVFSSVGTVTPTTPPETQPPVQPTDAPPAP
ncbi:MAG: starch-binding protein, partial [Ruminococcus sp.]|nr:starch-binding protein [Ruminococcus sp.]